jgi:methylmalonyl-CoA/ethylmalonyl-CoA epimerase
MALLIKYVKNTVTNGLYGFWHIDCYPIMKREYWGGNNKMKILNIDHVGVAVDNIGRARAFWTDVLGLPWEGSETVAEQKVTTGFFPVGGSEVELLESTSPDGPVARFIEKRGQGIQHIAFRVADIEAALDELNKKGIRLIDSTPRIGAGGAKIAFLHPKETNGVLVELCERR